MDEIFRHVQRRPFNAAFEQLGAQDIQQLIDLEVRFAQHLNRLIRFV